MYISTAMVIFIVIIIIIICSRSEDYEQRIEDLEEQINDSDSYRYGDDDETIY